MIDKLLELDGNILLWIQENLRSELTDPIVKCITYLGNGGILMIAACLLLIIIPKTRRLGIICSCSLAATFLVDNILLKNIIARTRPYEALEGLDRIIGAQPDYSFPSGHSGSAFSVAVPLFKETPRRIGAAVLVLALLISLSRLYVGVHYPSDVIAGILIGTFFGLLSCFVFHKATKSKDKLFPDKERHSGKN